MRIKTYEASSTREAVKKIKQDLGPDALILDTKYITNRKWFGLRKEKKVEVTAGIVGRRDTDSTDDKRQSVGTSKKKERSSGRFVRFDESGEAKKVRNVRYVIDSAYEHMLEVGIEKELAQRVVYMLDDIITASISSKSGLKLDSIKNEFSEQLSRILPVSPGIDFDHFEKQKIITLVGPTGVGKTTTIAKLSAIASVLKEKKVGLLSIDAYRISAYEQLKTYAEIIGLPVKLALSPQEAVKTIKEDYSDHEMILVDTVGRSPQHKVHMTELHSYVDAIAPTELHLTLSASVKYLDLMSIIEKYEDMAIDKVIFTKVDETLSLDSLINGIYKTKYPISYFCTGQSVPDDIETGNIDKLAEFLVSDEQLKEIINALRNE